MNTIKPQNAWVVQTHFRNTVQEIGEGQWKQSRILPHPTLPQVKSWRIYAVTKLRDIKISSLSCSLVLFSNSPAIALISQLGSQARSAWLLSHSSPPFEIQFIAVFQQPPPSLLSLRLIVASRWPNPKSISVFILLDISVRLRLLAALSLKLSFPWDGFSFTGPLTLCSFIWKTAIEDVFLGRADRTYSFFGLSNQKNGVALCSDGEDCRWSRVTWERMTECQKLAFLTTWNISYLSDIHMEIHNRQLGRWIWNSREKTWARYIKFEAHVTYMAFRATKLDDHKVGKDRKRRAPGTELWVTPTCEALILLSLVQSTKTIPRLCPPSLLIQHRGLGSSGQRAIYFSFTSPSSQL